MSYWCILRTAPSRTLPLASALVDAGYEAWTPQELQVRRVGRQRDRVDVPVPVTPAIVFARYDRLADLIALSRSPSQTYLIWDKELRRMVSRGVPYFTVFRHLDSYPGVADRALNPLRLAEQRRKPRALARVFKQGDPVTYADAGFEGLIGKVEANRGRYSLVIFPGFSIPIQFDPRHLIPVAAA